MAKAAKKRSKKKTAKRKGAAKRRKSSRKGKSAPKKSVRKTAKRKPAKKAPPPKNQETAWPVLFATIAAIFAGLVAAWVLSDFSMAANAAALSNTPIADAPWSAAYECAAKVVQTADTWLALAHPDLVPTLR